MDLTAHGIDALWLDVAALRHPGPKTRPCGRPKKTGGACNRPVSAPLPACRNHMTEEDWGKVRALTEAVKRELADVEQPPATPACWAWPVDPAWVADVLARGSNALALWQDDRCALCGGGGGKRVLDHDHETGWARGYLCVSCNLHEGHAWDREPVFRRYRRRPPAAMLGVWERYSSPWRGLDRGRLNRRETYAAHTVDVRGVVLLGR